MRLRKRPNVLGLSMAALLLAVVGLRAADSVPSNRFGTRIAPLLLLGRGDVRAELALTAEQSAAAEQEIAALHAKAAQLKGTRGGEAHAARTAIDVQQQQWLKRNLREAQVERLMQIELQWEGPAALITRAPIARKLELTPAQITELRQAVHRWNGERVPGVFDSTADARLEQAVSGTLTEDQRKYWSAMLGTRFRPRMVQVAESGPG